MHDEHHQKTNSAKIKLIIQTVFPWETSYKLTLQLFFPSVSAASLFPALPFCNCNLASQKMFYILGLKWNVCELAACTEEAFPVVLRKLLSSLMTIRLNLVETKRKPVTLHVQHCILPTSC